MGGEFWGVFLLSTEMLYVLRWRSESFAWAHVFCAESSFFYFSKKGGHFVSASYKISHLLPHISPHLIHSFFPHSPSPLPQTSLLPRHDPPGANQIIRIAGKQGLAVGAPGQADALGLAALLADSGVLGLELVDLALLLEVEDDDGARGGGAEPVAVRREGQGVHLVPRVQRVQVLGLVQVPQHRRAVLAPRGAERAVGRDGDRVDVACVPDVVGL